MSASIVSCHTSKRSATGIIGSADGPTGVYVANNDNQ